MNENQFKGLKEKIIQGGLFLIIRQGTGIVIGLGGMFALTKEIGPTNYGIYISVFGILTFLIKVSSLGLNIFLIRNEDDLQKRYFDQAFSLIMSISIVITILTIVISPIFETWFKSSHLQIPLTLMVLTLPLNALILTSTAKLERNLEFRSIAKIELGGQILYYAVALSIAYQNGSVYAPIIGYWIQQVTLLIGSTLLSGYRPKLFWSLNIVKEMVIYGFAFSSSMWIWQAKDLINPLIVGRLAGAEAVGYIAFSIRLVEALSFVKQATWRLSITALAKVQNDITSLKKSVDEGMRIQVLALVPFLVGFGLVSKWVIPYVFGDKWMPVIMVLPFISIAYLINAVFNMHSSVLYVLNRNAAVSYFHSAYILSLTLGCVVFIPVFGVTGYGIAEMAALLSYVVIHLQLSKVLKPNYSKTIPWLIGFIPLLFTSMIENQWILILFIPLLIILIVPSTRNQLTDLKKQFIRSTT